MTISPPGPLWNDQNADRNRKVILSAAVAFVTRLSEPFKFERRNNYP
jgi:hypothetical protein